jgi:hypothetical protein
LDTSAKEATSFLSRPSLHHASYMLGMPVRSVTVQGWADAKEKLKGVAEIVAVVAVESVGAIVDGELRAQSDVDAVAV